MKKLVIIRGLPGSGKTTLAKSMCKEGPWCHFEADMFFEKDGTYQYNRSLIGNAHFWCKNQAMKALQDGKNVIISNTFTTRREITDYLDFLKGEFDEIKIFTATGNYKNVHGVPDETIEKMKSRWVATEDLNL